jgi:methionine-rich copper-binding protein CopC
VYPSRRKSRSASRRDPYPLRWSFAATLRTLDGSSIELEAAKPDSSAYAKANGETYRVTLPDDLTAGSYRLVLEATAGRTRVTRELGFRVTGGE